MIGGVSAPDAEAPGEAGNEISGCLLLNQLMFTLLIIFVVILFFLEVIFGSCLEAYNAEIGYPADFKKEQRLSVQEFLFQLLPFAVLCSGGLYLFSRFVRS
ncbi:MAG: hypothetical protein ACWGKN_10395 [Desulfoprunum sp.]